MGGREGVEHAAEQALLLQVELLEELAVAEDAYAPGGNAVLHSYLEKRSVLAPSVTEKFFPPFR